MLRIPHSRTSSRSDVSSDSSTSAHDRGQVPVSDGARRWRPGVVMALITSSLVLGACGDSATVTQEFTGRLARVSEMRDSVETRIKTLRADCEDGVVQDPYCYNGETWYTDNVMGPINGWITEVEGDLTARKSLAGISSYDADLDEGITNAQAFNDWVDGVHRLYAGGGIQGANAAPSIDEVGKVVIDLGVAVWQQYQEGQKVHVDDLKEQIEGERYASFGSVA
jgi:hypothetical protein